MSGPRSSILALMLLGALAAGCRSSSEPAVADDSLFVNTMADLRRIRTDAALDSAARDSAREATLHSHGVSAEELEAMAREMAQDPKRALENWREVERLSVHRTTPPKGSEESDSTKR